MSCVFDIIFKIFGLFVDFVRAYDERLYESAGSYAQCKYKYHDHRQLEQLCDLALLDVYREGDGSDKAERHDDAVYPKCYVNIYEARTINSTGVCMQQVELLQEEVNCEHKVENHAQNDELAAGYVHQVLNVAVVDISGVTSLFLSVRVKRRFNSLFAHSSHSSDHGVIYRCAVDDLRLLVFFLFFEFRLRRQIIVGVVKDVRRSYRKQEHIVDYRNYHESDDRNEDDLVDLIQPVQIEDIESYIKVEQRVLQAEISRILRLEESEPGTGRCVHPDSETEYQGKYP